MGLAIVVVEVAAAAAEEEPSLSSNDHNKADFVDRMFIVAERIERLTCILLVELRGPRKFDCTRR